MFKVLLQYLIPWCILSAILLHLRAPLVGKVSENQGMSSTGLYMAYLESGSYAKYRMFEGEPALKEKVKDDRRTARGRRNINTGSDLSEQQLKLEEINLRTSINQDKQCWVNNKRTLIEITVQSSQQHIAIDLCIIFAYHIASKETSTETTFFATMALLFWKVSALPLNQPGSEEKHKIERPMIVQSKHKRKVRSAADVQSHFSQGKCQSEWFQNEDSCYRLFPGKMNYDSASEHCSSLQAKLVTLETKAENTFVDQLGNKFHPDGYLWAGVQNSCKKCSDIGRYVNWCPGQPDRKSNCVVLVETGRWKNFDCDYMFAFVCEKEPSKPTYSRQQLILAFLIPIFSCLTFAVTFTTFLLVSSLRRGNQALKISSRYVRKKGKRKIATWEMIETIRRASLGRASVMRRNSRQRASIPNIEITSPDVGGRAKPKLWRANPKSREEKRKQANGETNNRVKLWWKGEASKPEEAFLETPLDRRRSSGGGSSLYELLVTLNKMEFEPEKENQRNEVVELKRRDVEGAGEMSTGDGGEISGKDREKLVAKGTLNDEESCDRKRSFQNMAFRDSAASVETSAGTVGIRITSLDPGEDTPGQNDPGGNSSVEKAAERNVTGKETRREYTRGKETQEKESNSVRIKTHALNRMDYSRVVNGGDLEVSENTKVVKVDIHRTSKLENSILEPRNDTPEKTTKVINGDEPEMGENTKVVKVDVHGTSKPEDSPTTCDKVAMITALDLENDTPEKNSGDVSQDGESNCVELQSRAQDRDELGPSEELEPNEKTKTVKVDVKRTSKMEDNSSSDGSTETNNNEKINSKENVLWIYSV